MTDVYAVADDDTDALSSARANPAPRLSDGDNIVDLLRDLVNQGTHLADQQLSLIKAEVRESAGEIKGAAGALISAAVVGIAGLGVLLMGFAYLLADVLDNLALATLIVGAITVALGFILYRSAAEKMAVSSLTPDRTQRTIQRTPDAVRGDL